MWKRIFKRAGRTVLAVGIAVGTAYATSSPYALILAPLISAIGKWARERGIEPMPL